jgi:D-alanyl-D-alanine carboxypeptidase (penicillin-binding protein 5/6)
MKTGHTSVSGYGLVGTAERDGRRLILVVNGLESERQRAEETRRLMELGFNAFDRYDLFAEGDMVGEAEVFAGAVDTVPLILTRDVQVMMRKSARNDMKVTVNYVGPLEAPIAAGQQVATLRIAVPDKEAMVLPLHAGAPVAKAGIWKRMGMAVNHLVFGQGEAAEGDDGAGTGEVIQEIDADAKPAQ